MTAEIILTDDAIHKLIVDFEIECDCGIETYPVDNIVPFARAIEQAVLAKLVEQHTPIAWLHEETGDVISSELKDDAPEMLKGYDTPLYRCSVPNSQVSLDNSNHIAGMRKKVKENHIPDDGKMVPDGWQLVPIEPTDEMLVSGQEEWVLGKRGAMEDCEESKAIFKAMLAAAPKFREDQ